MPSMNVLTILWWSNQHWMLLHSAQQEASIQHKGAFAPQGAVAAGNSFKAVDRPGPPASHYLAVRYFPCCISNRKLSS